MKRNILSTYSFTVCFISLMCGVIGFGLFSYNIVKLFATDFTMSVHERRTLASNEEFRFFYGNDRNIPEEEDKVTRLREQEYRFAIDLKRHEARQKLLFYGIILMINIAMYTTHWKIGTKSLAKAPGNMEHKVLNPL